jgi:hypothetical protein
MRVLPMPIKKFQSELYSYLPKDHVDVDGQYDDEKLMLIQLMFLKI